MFVQERFVDRSKALQDMIKQNKLPLFSNPRTAHSSPKQKELASMKSNCSLFSQLSGNLEDFFAHENQAYPPSISLFGALRQGTKSDLLKCL